MKKGTISLRKEQKRLRFISAMLVIFLLTVVFPFTQSMYAQNMVNQLTNPSFEFGTLSPWQKWPSSAPGVIGVENCCGNRTPGGTWNAFVQPESQDLALYQSFPAQPNQVYYLEAWVALGWKGMNAELRWAYANSSTPGIAQLCQRADTNISWPNYQKLSCIFTAPSQISAFNVQLYVSSAPSGYWVVTDDWVLDIWRNNQVGNDLPTSIGTVADAKDYTQYLYTGSGPTTPGGFTSGWIGLELGGSPTNAKFLQVGLSTTNYGPEWFVYGENTVACLQGISTSNGRGCNGGVNQRVGYGSWHKVELVTYSQGFWIARVYDASGNASDVARIYFPETHVYRAYTVVEEGIAFDRNTDPLLKADFAYYHPQYMQWGTGFREWPNGSGIFTAPSYPNSPCPGKYGVAPRLNGDPRFWWMGSGGSTCSGFVF